ncbi:hypothetical protein ACFIOZ_07540 [Vreelandella sp. F11]|uniref:hypothetical protein n=1 Tax=Vreelandella sp. F11 TaxID=3394751 RepID=UPI0036D88FDF
MCKRDLVARGKPTAHPREQREAVPGFGLCGQSWFRALGRRSAASRGCLIRSSLARFVTTRYGCLHEAKSVGFVVRGKPTAHLREQRAAVQGLAEVPLGVVPLPNALT